MASSWRPLRIPQSAGHLPPLLIATAFKADSYTIHLTDLTYIWCETLDHRGILQRSQEENTNIDPSGGDQLQIFLDKVKLGVEGGRDTTSALTISADAGCPAMTLNIVINLPGGLAPLEWPIYLAAAPQALLTHQLTIPLLQAQHARVQEIASLAEGLRDKDHVIQKLVDKLEDQGTQLGQVFPQAAGKAGRQTDRKKAEQKVKGLGPFDIDCWRKGLDSQGSQAPAVLVGSVFENKDDEAVKVQMPTQAVTEMSNWWEDIKGNTINLSTGNAEINGPLKSTKGKQRAKPTAKTEESFQEDGDFQVQATPPHLVTNSPTKAPSKQFDIDSTDDEDEDPNAPSQRSKILDSFPSSPPAAKPLPKPTRKFGILGKKKPAPKASSPDTGSEPEGENPSPRKQSPKNPPTDDTTDGEPSPPPKQISDKKAPTPVPVVEDTTNDDEPPPKGPTKSPSPQSSPAPKKRALGRTGGREAPSPPPAELFKRKGKLGQIGGKKKAASPPPPSPSAPAPEPADRSSSPPAIVPKKKKLGAIGGRDKTPKKEGSVVLDEENGEGRERGRPVTVEKENTPEPRETSTERADRKRALLKKELEEKSKAPVKKKRKF